MTSLAHRPRFAAAAASAAIVAALAACSPAQAAVSFSANPNVPNLPGVTLNGQAQPVNATMANWGVTMTGSKTGWNVTVAGDTSAGKSADFQQYCPNATCGTDSGPAYITGGATLPAGSLKLNSTSASWTGNTGTTPSHLCNAGCSMDTTSAVKIASATTSVSTGTWSTTGYSATSVAATIPTTTKYLTQSGEVYHLDLVFTLATGP
ncbi:MAG: hypothetical protein E6G53_00365 [Actinobacteria bacterium]|nr:MAG: hypothetical protein E6G53_00365 [Actinomycetota bacterium]